MGIPPAVFVAMKPRKQFACDRCDKVYPRNQSLQAHIIQVHSGGCYLPYHMPYWHASSYDD